MSDQRLPSTVITQQLASKNAELNGAIAVSKLPRLAAALTSADGQAKVKLCFEIDEQRRRRVVAEVSCDVHILCQRCLKPMPLTIDSKVEAVIVANDDAAQQVPREMDPIVAEEGVLDTYQFVEDELLLCLPFTSFHEYNCGVNTNSDEESQLSETHKPFADLANIMNKS